MISYLMTTILAFTNIFRVKGLLNGSEPVCNIFYFLYFSIITWTTTGYGDIIPSPDSRIYAASEALIDYLTMALFASILFHLISSRNK